MPSSNSTPMSQVLDSPARHAATKGQTCEEPPEAGWLSDQGDSDEPIPANIAHVTGFRPVTLVELRGFELGSHHIGSACSCLGNCTPTRHFTGSRVVLRAVDGGHNWALSGCYVVHMLCKQDEHAAGQAR